MSVGTGVYKKPKVTKRGSSPEPVEAGCCLRSCGGVPAVQPTTRDETAKKILTKARKW